MQPWILYAILAAVSASFVAIFGKIGISKVDSTLATTIRAIIMALVLVIATFSLGKFNLIKTIDNRALFFITLSALAGAVSWIFYFMALKFGPASAVSALDKTSVIFVFVFALIFLAEKFTWMKAVGAIAVGVGAILMAL